MIVTIPTSIHRKIDLQYLGALPLCRYEGKIILHRDAGEARRALKLLLLEKRLGFDTETRPAFKRGQHYDPALVQVATADAVHIFQLKFCGGVAVLRPLFESEFSKKACLGVADDVRQLRAVQDFEPRGFVELSDATKALGVADCGLKKLCANLLGMRISKREQTSNWAREELTEGQLRYAATDAWVSLLVYEVALELARRGIGAEE